MKQIAIDRSMRRRGSVPLMLSLVFVVVISSAAVALLQLEISRAGNRHRAESSKRLQIAIDEVRRLGIRHDEVVRLPLDESSGSWIEVEWLLNESNDPLGGDAMLSATEFRDGRVTLTKQTPVRRETNDKP